MKLILIYFGTFDDYVVKKEWVDGPKMPVFVKVED